MKKLLFLFALIIQSVVFVAQDRDSLIFISTTTPPTFSGGAEAMEEYIRSRLVYPSKAIQDSIEGRVLVSFYVDSCGYINNIRILESLHPACDSVALSVVKGMPKWIPSKSEPYMEFKLPIIFTFPDKNIKTVCDTMPCFPGGMDSLFQFIHRNLKYPVRGDYCIQGRVIIRFVVTREGKIKDPVVRRGIEYYFDEEALRVVRLMPDWEPAIHNGEKVDCYFTLPMLFRPYY